MLGGTSRRNISHKYRVNRSVFFIQVSAFILILKCDLKRFCKQHRSDIFEKTNSLHNVYKDRLLLFSYFLIEVGGKWSYLRWRRLRIPKTLQLWTHVLFLFIFVKVN